jgi:3-hydroxyisobutyrate dehydrogenase-like beta-hydroxyacid dehydrogenase
MTTRVGFIGLGNIGKPMAERLVTGGLSPIVFDVRAVARTALAARGARVAASCAEVAREADVIGICVRDDADVRSATLGPDGVIAHARPDAIIAIHSTVLPGTVRVVGRIAAERGVGVIDAPITGAAVGAETGTLTYMVGGPAELVDRCRPVFATAAGRIVHTGALGSGAIAKLCNNLMGYLGFLAAYEATLLADNGGLSFDAMVEVTRGGHLTELMHGFAGFRRRIGADPDDAALQARARDFADLAEKDLAVTLAFAREQGITLPGTALCQQLMARVYGVRDDRRR